MPTQPRLVIAVALLSLTAFVDGLASAGGGADARSEQERLGPGQTPLKASTRSVGDCPASVASEEAGGIPELLVYEVNKNVAGFPDKQDLSTPEAAYATLIRALVTGDPTRWGELVRYCCGNVPGG